LGRPLGEELLVPTNIYVPEVVQMLDEALSIRALIHVTSDGFLNLLRVMTPAVGYVIDQPLPPPPIFSVIQRCGNLDDAEMFRVYNMGTGFCVVSDPAHAQRVVDIARAHGRTAAVIGYTVHDPQQRVWIPGHQLVGREESLERAAEAAPSYPAR
jgi:phosphoribosylformylglycinamidine cyclo-ligase